MRYWMIGAPPDTVAKLKSVETEPRYRRLPFRKKLLFATVVFLAFFAFLELVLWATGTETLIEREDPFRGFSGLVTVFEADSDRYRTRRSSLETFNDQSFLAEKPADGFRIFCLGGSSSYGFPWGAEVAFTAIVGEALAASHPELLVEAVNASGISYAMHRLNIVADELLAYQPNVFIIYSGHNEFIEPAFFEALKRRSTTRTRLEHALSHSRFYSGMRATFQRLSAEQPSTDHDFDARVRRDQTRVFSLEEKEAIVAEYRWRLERLVRRAHAAGVKVVLVTVPANMRQWRPEASTGVAILSEADRQKWSEAYSSGRRGLNADQFAEATTSLEKAANLAPRHAETQFLLAQALEGLAQWDDARAAYRRACDADASPTRRVSGINDVIRQVAQGQGALLVDADHIVEQRSEHGLVGLNLIEDYVHPTREGHEIIAWHIWTEMTRAGWLGDTKPAEWALFDQVIAQRQSRLMSKNSAWFFNQGVVLLNQGHREAAIEKFREALALSPDYEGAMENLGALLCQTGKYTEAVGLFQRLIKIDPNSAEAHNNLGGALQGLGRPQEAVAHYQKALRIKPDDAGVYNNLGNARRGMGRSDEAVAHYQQALRIMPDYAEAHSNLGLALRNMGRIEEAVAHFQEALRIKPDLARAHYNLAITLQDLGRLNAAIMHYQEALLIKPGYAEAHNRLGTALAALGRFKEALAHYNDAVRHGPKNVAAANNLAWLLATCPDADVRDGKRALELATRLAKRQGAGSYAILDTLSAAHAEVGNLEEAVRWQEKAVNLAPDAQKNVLTRRLELYKRGEPYREKPQAMSDM